MTAVLGDLRLQRRDLDDLMTQRTAVLAAQGLRTARAVRGQQGLDLSDLLQRQQLPMLSLVPRLRSAPTARSRELGRLGKPGRSRGRAGVAGEVSPQDRLQLRNTRLRRSQLLAELFNQHILGVRSVHSLLLSHLLPSFMRAGLRNG